MIRTATEDDAPRIRVLAQTVPGFWHAEWRPDAIERAMHAADGLALVWEDGGNIVGFSCAHDVGFLGYLSLLVVDESARGKGIGTELVRRTERELAARGCATLISDVWQDAVGFYQSLGWSTPGAVLLRQKLIRKAPPEISWPEESNHESDASSANELASDTPKMADASTSNPVRWD